MALFGSNWIDDNNIDYYSGGIFRHWLEETSDADKFKAISGKEVSNEDVRKEIEKVLEDPYTSNVERHKLLDFKQYLNTTE